MAPGWRWTCARWGFEAVLKLPPLNAQTPIVDAQGRPTPQFLLFWQRFIKAIEDAFNGQAAALEAAGIALDAAETANTAAETAQNAANSTAAATALSTSYVDGLTVQATDAGASATITISAHDRIYPGSAPVAVSGGALTGLAYDTAYWVYYVDPDRTGGAVTYLTSTTPVGNGSSADLHLVASQRTPVAAGSPVDGLPTLPPGAAFP